MTESPKVIFNYKFVLALNNPDNKNKNSKKTIKRTTGMFDYYADEKKKAMGIFDYYTGNINKNDKMNLILENGRYATKEDIDKRKRQYERYIEKSNLCKCVISFNNDYINENIDIHKLEKLLVKEIIPMFLKKCGYKDVSKMSYQASLHTDTDNLHFHFSFIEKEPNYQYNRNKIGFKRVGLITDEQINFLKNQIVHSIEKEKIYTPLLISTNKEIDELKKYFNPKEKNFLLRDKDDLILEHEILKLGQLLYEKREKTSKRIKFNSIKDKEIKDLTKSIKNHLFTKKNVSFQREYQNFQDGLKKLNKYFYNISKSNQINNSSFNKDLMNSKQEYIDNYIYNAIVNHANFLYQNNSKRKTMISESAVLEEIVFQNFKKNKIQTRSSILKNYLSISLTSRKGFANRYHIERAIKNINYEMDEAIREFSKLFSDKTYGSDE